MSIAPELLDALDDHPEAHAAIALLLAKLDYSGPGHASIRADWRRGDSPAWSWDAGGKVPPRDGVLT